MTPARGYLNPIAFAAAASLALAFLAGCGRADGPAAATQVAARVNADEITVHQVNAVLAKAAATTKEEAAAEAKREALERLIDRQLAVQQALRRKLDRSPEVVQALEAAKAEVLARAFAEEIARQQPKPTREEVKKYYAEHPELFSQRRVFLLEEIGIPATAEVDSLSQIVAKARSIQEVSAWLRSQGVKYAENRVVRTAEQIPLELLPRLHAMKEGEMHVIEGGGRIQVLRVASIKPAPVDEATASPRIQQYLFNRRASEAIAKEMKQVKAGAAIEYRGEFAPGTGTAADEEKVK